MRLLPVAVAVLLALAPVAGALAAPTPAAGPSDGDARAAVAAPENGTGNGTVRVLDLPPDAVSRSGVTRHSVDLGPALGFDRDATDRHVETEATLRAVRAAGDDSERSRRILDAVNDLEQRALGLRDEQRAAVAAYVAGDLPPRAFLERLAEIDAAARALDHRRDRIATLAKNTSGIGIGGRLAALGAELDTFTGPVRNRAGAVLRGEASRTRFYVAAGNGSVVLSTVTGDTYLREAFRGTLRNRAGGTIDPEDALNATAESYPAVWSARRNSTEVVGSGNSFLVRVPHRQGHLTAFVDSGSGAVFKEFQRRPVPTMGDGEGVSAARDELGLTVNRSYPGAPLRIRLVDDSGSSVDANITVGRVSEERSDFVGTTGDDGLLWSLTPGERFTVTAIRGNAVVVLTLDPAPPPLVGGGNATDGSG